MPPICPGCPAAGEGAIADLLRVNLGVPPVTQGDASRLGLLGGDLAGFPNGRRVFDDVTESSRAWAPGRTELGLWSRISDIFKRVGAGVLAGPPFRHRRLDCKSLAPGMLPGASELAHFGGR